MIQTCRLYLPLPLGGLTNGQIEKGDVIIGTGSRTHLPILLYKKKYAIPAIICMTPAMHLLNRFDLCFVPEHEGRKEERNIMLTAGAPNCSRNKKKHQNECGLILLGGVDTKSHYWDSLQVVEKIEKIVKTETWRNWTISSSPRTPQDTVEMIKKLTDECSNTLFFDYRNTPPGWIEEQYDKNSVVWVTADSVSMIYEAITAGCSVGIFPMRWVRENSKFMINENVLLEKKLVTPFSSWEKGMMNQVENRELNEAKRCAERILQTWWPSVMKNK